MNPYSRCHRVSYSICAAVAGWILVLVVSIGLLSRSSGAADIPNADNTTPAVKTEPAPVRFLSAGWVAADWKARD